MTDGAPSAEAHDWLHQLQICKLLQHKDMVLCLKGLSSKLEASQFTFQELPLWNAAAPGEPTHKSQLIEVDLGSLQSESITTTIQTPTITLVLHPSLAYSVVPSQDITTVEINLHLRGALEWLQWASPVASASVSCHSTPGRQPPLVALGALLSAGGTDDPLRPEGTDSIIPTLMTTLQQTSLWVATPDTTTSFTLATHPLLQLTVLKTLEVASTPLSHGLRPPPRVNKLVCQISFFSFRIEWTWF